MNKPPVQQLDELAQTQPGALEAALEELVSSGFGDLQAQLEQRERLVPAGGDNQSQMHWGWW